MAKSNAINRDLSSAMGISGTSQLSGFVQAQNLNGGTGASSTTYLRGDGVWVSNPHVGTINALTVSRFQYYSNPGTDTALSSLTYTAPAIPVFNSSGAMSVISGSTPGAMLIGSDSGAPAMATITAGNGITITNSNNNIAIALSRKANATVVTGSSASMVWGGAYIANNASGVTFTLPATAPVGSILRIMGMAVGSWTIAQNAGQSITISSSSVSTTGVAGSVTSSGNRDSLTLICVVANTQWSALINPLSSGLVVV